ncbi:cysteine desulfurase [bacterium]|nr:cysteine desulfurase [bacterium]MBU2461445.1 cysteine desulfurase [bacterium]
MDVYLDHVSTTRMHPEVLEAMMPYLRDNFGNPSNQHHIGQASRKGISQAREQVAALIGADTDEIIFASSGTEANNLALKGVALANQQKGKHIIVSSIEHFSVLHSARTLEKMGFQITYLPVDASGLVNPADVEKAITTQTILVCVQLANPEVGTIEPIEAISRITSSKGVFLHTDAVAAVGIMDVDVERLGVDLLSLSGHQFYGPKGAAALFVRKGTRITPLFDGGIQERGRRAGTENVAGIVGLGKAAEMAKDQMCAWAEHILALKQRLWQGINKRIEHVCLNGHPDLRLPGNLNFGIRFVEGESILILLDMEGIMASSGSACTSQGLKSSHVLKAMGVKPVDAHGSLLFSLGRENTPAEIDYVLEKLPPIVKRLREMSPLYKEGNRDESERE